MGTTIGSTQFRAAEQIAFNNKGKIGTDAAEKLGKAARKEDPAVARQMLEQDSFDVGAQQAFAKAAGVSTKNLPKNTIAGQTVGSATILRTLGDPKGYANPLEAITSARMTGVANAGVVKQGDSYYPVELSKASSGQLASSGDLSKAIGLPPYNQQTVDDLRGQLQTERAKTRPNGATLETLQKQLASAITGLPPESFKVIGRSEDRAATTVDGTTGIPKGINIQNGLFKASDGALGTHGPAAAGGEGFDPKKPTAISLDAGELEGRKRVKDEKVDGKYVHNVTTELPTTDSVLGVLHHEASHLEDFEEAKKWVDKSGVDFSPGQPNKQFADFMAKQLKNHTIDNATFARVTNTVRQLGNDTEAHAHIASAVDAIRNGAPDVAKEQLVEYATSAAKSGASPSPQELNHLLADASRAYRAMSKDQKTQFDAALKAANAISGSPLKGFDPKTFNLKKDV